MFKKFLAGMRMPTVSAKMVAFAIATMTALGIGGALTYSKVSGNGVGVNVAGSRLGAWFDQDTGEMEIEVGDFGCCKPMCSDSFELECQQYAEGGIPATFDSKNCNQIDECKDGCCQLDCIVKKLPKSACEYMGGDWSETCDIGCCATDYSQNEIPEKSCDCVANSTWFKGTCTRGFYVYLTDSNSGRADFTDDFGDKNMGSGLNKLVDMFGGNRDVSMSVEYDLYTCGETPYGDWYGTKKTITYSGATGETTTEEEEADFTFTKEGFEYNTTMLPGGGATMGFSNKIEGNQMTIDFKIPLMPDVHATGTIHQGAEECRNKKTLGN